MESKQTARRHPLYGTWYGMWRRCTDPKNRAFKHYGGRGISVCDRWKDFWLFVADVGVKPSPKHSIERIKNDLGYEPGNTRWATPKEQALNKRGAVQVTLKGVTLPLVTWLEQLGISRSMYEARTKRLGWTPEEALQTPKFARVNMPPPLEADGSVRTRPIDVKRAARAAKPKPSFLSLKGDSCGKS